MGKGINSLYIAHLYILVAISLSLLRKTRSMMFLASIGDRIFPGFSCYRNRHHNRSWIACELWFIVLGVCCCCCCCSWAFVLLVNREFSLVHRLWLRYCRNPNPFAAPVSNHPRALAHPLPIQTKTTMLRTLHATIEAWTCNLCTSVCAYMYVYTYELWNTTTAAISDCTFDIKSTILHTQHSPYMENQTKPNTHTVQMCTYVCI